MKENGHSVDGAGDEYSDYNDDNYEEEEDKGDKDVTESTHKIFFGSAVVCGRNSNTKQGIEVEDQ